MGVNASKELESENQPCRLKDVNERLHQIMMDFIHESSTSAKITEKREEHMKELQQQQQLQQMQRDAIASAQQQNNGTTGNNNMNHHQQFTQHPGDVTSASALSDTVLSTASTAATHHNNNNNQNNNNEQQEKDPFAPQPVPTLGIAVELRNKSIQAGTGEQIETIHRIWIALTVPGAGLGNEGAIEAANPLQRAANLEFLDLAYNEITSEGLVHLCPAVASSEAGQNCLRFLRLSGNEIQTKEDKDELSGVKAVADLIEKCPQLQEVQLFNCGITDEGVLAIVNGLRMHDSIRYINLGRNRTTRKSILMLTELVKRCKTILAIHVDADITKDSDYADLEAALEVNRAEAHKREERRQVLDHKRSRRDAQMKEEARIKDEQNREERLRIEAEIAAKEAELRQHEENARQLEALREEKNALKRQRLQQQRAAQSQEAIERAMSHAYEWKNKLGVSSGKSAIYQDGFQQYTRQLSVDPRDGSTKESMVPYERNPNRLKACWCDPSDAAVPYARKLHYHCKHENASVDLLGAAKDLTDTSKYTTTDLPQYQGCRATGHICSTVGYYTKPLPNKSAAHFFSSQHPSYADDE